MLHSKEREYMLNQLNQTNILEVDYYNNQPCEVQQRRDFLLHKLSNNASVVAYIDVREQQDIPPFPTKTATGL